MLAALLLLLASSVCLASGVEITFPVDGEAYSSPDLSVRAVLDFENQIADQVVYFLNGGPSVAIPRLDTDWYTYMGNDLHTGFSESPAPHDATVLWTASVTGDLHEFCTPVIVDGIVYYASQFGLETLFALDAATGEFLWSFPNTGPTDDAVTVKDGLLYIASDSVWCLDALTGDRHWAFGGDGSPFSGTPVVASDRVIVTISSGSGGSSRSSVYALDRLDGSVLWATDWPWQMQCCPAAFGDKVILPFCSGISPPLLALHLSDGSEAWSFVEPGGEGYWDSSPSISEGVLYIGAYSGAAYAIDPFDGSVLWQNPLGDWDINSTPAIHDGRVFLSAGGPVDDGMIALDASTGDGLWLNPNWAHGSEAVADGLVFWGDVDSGIIYAASEATGETVWSFPTAPGAIFEYLAGSPAVTDGVMYYPAGNWLLYAFGTGLEYSYDGPITADIGWNELIVEADCPGGTVLADTVSFLVDPYGIEDDILCGPASPALHILGNPAGDFARLLLVSPSRERADIQVFDTGGRMVAEASIAAGSPGQVDIDMSGAPAGTYLIRWMQGDLSGTARLVRLR